MATRAKDNAEEQSLEVKSFHYRTQTLITLSDGKAQRFLRNTRLVCAALRLHHAQLVEDINDPVVLARYWRFWGNFPQWRQRVIGPSVRGALLDGSAWSKLLFGPSIPPFQVGLLDAGAELTEDEECLRYHVRLTMSHVRQLLLHSVVPSSPPWNYCQLFDPETQATTLDFMRRTHEAIVEIASGATVWSAGIKQTVDFLLQPVVFEPLELLAQGAWGLHSEQGQRAMAYVQAMFQQMWTSLPLELGFNDLRNNERRSARHQQRSNEMLQSLAISSMTSRFQGTPSNPLVLDLAHAAKIAGVHCSPKVFAPPSHKDAKASGLDMDGLRRRSYAGMESMTTNHLPLVHAMVSVPKADWPALWHARWLRLGMVISREDGAH